MSEDHPEIELEVDEPIPASVELHPALWKRINLERDDDETIGDWIRDAVTLRFTLIDRDSEVRPESVVEVPPKIAERARLWAEYKTRDGSESYEKAFLDALTDYVQPQATYTLDGEPIASFVRDVDDPREENEAARGDVDES